MPESKNKLFAAAFFFSIAFMALSSFYAVFFVDEFSRKTVILNSILIFLSLMGLLILMILLGIGQYTRELAKVTKNIAEGNMSGRVNIKEENEIGYLVSSINKMLDVMEKSEEKLKEERDQIKAIINSMGEGLLVINNDHKIVLANSVAEKILKISSGKATGKDMKEIVSFSKNKEKISRENCPVSRVLNNKESANIGPKDNFYCQSASGKEFPVEMTIKPLSSHGKTCAVVVFKDATEAKLLDEEREFSKHNLENVLKSVYIERDNVEREKNKIETILNSIGDSVLAMDEEKRVIIFNPTAEKMTGFSSAEIINYPYNKFLKFTNETDKKEIADFADAALAGKAQSAGNHILLATKNKGPISVDITAAPIKNNDGKNIGCIVVFRDVTEKREAERMRYDFISIVSHQLRTPLSAMKWLLEILLEKDVGSLKPKQFDVVKEINSSNRNMIDFVNQMLNVSRIESDRLGINPETLNLNGAIKDIIKEIKPFIKEKRQKMEFAELKDKSMRIKTDKNLLRNIINSLLVNASRYTPAGGKITLTVKKNDKDEILFKISDTGIGIPEKERDKIFRKFSRADNAIKYEANGTGLGLYIVKSILDMIGGKIWFKSIENKGATFFFTIPIESVVCDIKQGSYKKSVS